MVERPPCYSGHNFNLSALLTLDNFLQLLDVFLYNFPEFCKEFLVDPIIKIRTGWDVISVLINYSFCIYLILITSHSLSELYYSIILYFRHFCPRKKQKEFKGYCCICFEEELLISCNGQETNHGICKECLQEYANSKYKAMRESRLVILPCPVCNHNFNLKTITNICPKVAQLEKDLRVRFNFQNTCRNWSHIVECKSTNCVGIDEFSTNRAYFECCVCKNRWQNEYFSRLSWLMLGFWQARKHVPQEIINVGANVRSCPACGVVIMKQGGCDHVTCANCGNHFMWSWNT